MYFARGDYFRNIIFIASSRHAIFFFVVSSLKKKSKKSQEFVDVSLSCYLSSNKNRSPWSARRTTKVPKSHTVRALKSYTTLWVYHAVRTTREVVFVDRAVRWRNCRRRRRRSARSVRRGELFFSFFLINTCTRLRFSTRVLRAFYVSFGFRPSARRVSVSSSLRARVQFVR